MTIRIGTRGSALALAQARLVADAVTAATGTPVELVEIVTAGDRSGAPVATLGVGVFVSALRDALAGKEVDLAVHSYKDLPTAATDGPGRGPRGDGGWEETLRIAAVPERADPRDALVARDRLSLAALPAGARIGTGSPRRAAQLRALRRGWEPVPVRGNVDTRLGRVAAGELDAVVLARAGLERLGRIAEITDTFDPAQLLPAPAQGALAVECRAGDRALADALAVVDHPPTRAAVTAERALLSTLEAGCSAPVAGLAELTTGGELRLRGAVFSPDGQVTIWLIRSGTVPPGDVATAAAQQLGRDLAADLLAAGADRILGSNTS